MYFNYIDPLILSATDGKARIRRYKGHFIPLKVGIYAYLIGIRIEYVKIYLLLCTKNGTIGV